MVQMNGWTEEFMKKQIDIFLINDEQMNEWIDEWIARQIDER